MTILALFDTLVVPLFSALVCFFAYHFVKALIKRRIDSPYNKILPAPIIKNFELSKDSNILEYCHDFKKVRHFAKLENSKATYNVGSPFITEFFSHPHNVLNKYIPEVQQFSLTASLSSPPNTVLYTYPIHQKFSKFVFRNFFSNFQKIEKLISEHLVNIIENEALYIGNNTFDVNNIFEDALFISKEIGISFTPLYFYLIFVAITIFNLYNNCCYLSHFVQRYPSSMAKLRLVIRFLEKMPYLDASMIESARLTGTGPTLRISTSNFFLSNGFKIPKNSSVKFNPFTYSRDPGIFFNDPHDFIPERNILENVKLSEPSYRNIIWGYKIVQEDEDAFFHGGYVFREVVSRAKKQILLKHPNDYL
ncbi:hypothetical protein BB560_002200 [Smittium megazygosporum]|uniref:Cytochrome P450 n=1 Tax=Smittium megazygosporum TaxID=133381 RepID=A0A2T9ZFH4_9FUNG|nr:hypothetical protein BB560_002200 [Smittium megazygosporum]